MRRDAVLADWDDDEPSAAEQGLPDEGVGPKDAAGADVLTAAEASLGAPRGLQRRPAPGTAVGILAAEHRSKALEPRCRDREVVHTRGRRSFRGNSHDP